MKTVLVDKGDGKIYQREVEDHPTHELIKTFVGFGCNIDHHQDFDDFMKKYGKALSLEIMSFIYDSMVKNKDISSGLSEYKLHFKLEKCKRF